MTQTRLDSLRAIEEALWHALQHAVGDRSHPWRTPVLATTDGSIGDARTVVLREVDRECLSLRLYCDGRSPKVAQLTSHPLGTLVMWSPALAWQLRIRVRVEVSSEGLEVSSRWARLKLSPAAHDYLSAQPPGTPLEATLSARGERAHFALLDAQVESIDWLELHADGHRRARFVPGATPCWLQP
jgi:pyridoxine/pyridoxamine 5'-phosphate oxidase